MTTWTGSSRRALLAKLALLFNGVIGAVLAVPIIRYLLSPVTRGRNPGYASWISLGGADQFPAGETRLATFRKAHAEPWDGQTADVPCWVRSVDGQVFQVFAINCAHLGCPVRWFPQSKLFMCPCHGGVYYSDGSHAAGPPPRGLFEYGYRIERGELLIKVGEMPTTGNPTGNIKGATPPCA